MAVVGSYGPPTVGTPPKYRTSTGGVQYGTPPKYRTYKAPVPGPAVAPPPWAPPPIPAGFYNPSRDIEEAEGKRGSEQQERSLTRQRTNAENDYATSTTLAGTNHENLLKQLGESFARLGVRQGEHENAQLGSAGVGGGALLASAAVRSANQGKEAGKENERYGNELGRLLQGFNELAGPGGSLTEQQSDVKENEQGFQSGLDTLKGHEAAEHGYEAPTAPAAPPKLSVRHFVRGSVKPGGTVEKSGRKLRTIRTYT